MGRFIRSHDRLEMREILAGFGSRASSRTTPDAAERAIRLQVIIADHQIVETTPVCEIVAQQGMDS